MYFGKDRKHDVTNGPGIRTTLFVSGCTNACPGCFNYDAQNFKYGKEFTQAEEDRFVKNSMDDKVVGISILGGDPMDQTRDGALLHLLRRLNQEVKKPIWIWTGYTFEEVMADEKKKELLMEVDVLIDGRFEEEKRDIRLMYRGSSNQRVILVKETLTAGKIIEMDLGGQ